MQYHKNEIMYLKKFFCHVIIFSVVLYAHTHKNLIDERCLSLYRAASGFAQGLRVKGKQVKCLYDLVTVFAEYTAELCH